MAPIESFRLFLILIGQKALTLQKHEDANDNLSYQRNDAYPCVDFGSDRAIVFVLAGVEKDDGVRIERH